MIKLLAYVFGGASAFGAALYFAVYLYRWEWQRALIAGVLVVICEILLACTVVVSRIARLEQRVLSDEAARERSRPRPARHPAPQGRAEDVRLRLAQSREHGAPRFAWLRGADGTERTYVFIPVLLATGALLSGTAWVVQRIAAATARPTDRRLAGRLAVLGAPAEAVTEPGPDLDGLPVLTSAGPRRWRRRILGAAVLALCLTALITTLQELTETRGESRPDASATAVLLEVSVRGDHSPHRRDILAHQLWTRCRTSTSVIPDSAMLSHVKGDMYAGVVHPALTGHDRMRLRGCLSDAQVDRVTFDVVGEGQLDRG
jgi:hypothetical protein